EEARTFASYLERQAGDGVEAQVALALRRTLQRNPTAAEVARGVEFIRKSQHDHQLSAAEGLQRFCVIALNLNEFLFLE
ncbi:MAG: hypothetical protein WD648_13700, partial [Planctomycetaceae bacterium]